MSEAQTQKNTILEDLQVIAEVLSKATVTAEEVVGTHPDNLKEGVRQEPTCSLAKIEDVVNIVDGQARYLLGRLGEIQQRL